MRIWIRISLQADPGPDAVPDPGSKKSAWKTKCNASSHGKFFTNFWWFLPPGSAFSSSMRIRIQKVSKNADLVPHHWQKEGDFLKGLKVIIVKIDWLGVEAYLVKEVSMLRASMAPCVACRTSFRFRSYSKEHSLPSIVLSYGNVTMYKKIIFFVRRLRR